MPTYQYVCTDCGAPLEAVQSFDDAALTDCPTCGGRLRKVFSAVGVVFKGSGFYRTDSRSKSGGADGAAKPKEGKDNKEKAGSAAGSSSSSSSDSSAGTSSSSSSGSSSSGSSSSGSGNSGGSSAA